jgi:hypothetical protein
MLRTSDTTWLEALAQSPLLTVLCAGAALWTLLAVAVLLRWVEF